MADARNRVTRHGKACSSVFDLLGHGENDLTAALGFTLARSSRLLTRLVARLVPKGEAAGAAIAMETADDLGRTDLEITTREHLIVVEAKRGWTLPTVEQLASYAGRIRGHGGGLLVTLSDCSAEWAELKLPPSVDGVTVTHLPWTAVRADLAIVQRAARGTERIWLDELDDYLRRAIRVRDPGDALAYCVVLSTGRPGGGGSRTFLDFVLGENVYYHPFGWGGGWPTLPPNFFAFRWDNKVRRIQRVMSHEVIPDLQSRWTDIPEDPDTIRPHIVHHLGPPLRMEPVPNGKPYRANRMWVLVDQLLTCDTLADALAASDTIRNP